MRCVLFGIWDTCCLGYEIRAAWDMRYIYTYCMGYEKCAVWNALVILCLSAAALKTLMILQLPSSLSNELRFKKYHCNIGKNRQTTKRPKIRSRQENTHFCCQSLLFLFVAIYGLFGIWYARFLQQCFSHIYCNLFSSQPPESFPH